MNKPLEYWSIGVLGGQAPFFFARHSITPLLHYSTSP